MHIVGKRPGGGYVIGCVCDDEDVHEFRVKKLGLSVECPNCGATAIGTDLLTTFHLQGSPEAGLSAAAAVVGGPRIVG